MRLMLFFDGRYPRRAWPVLAEYIRPNEYPRKSNSPFSGKYACSDNAATWGTYEQAEKRAKEDALGLVLSEDDNFTAYDFDKCRNPNRAGQARDGDQVQPRRVEIYGHGRYVTITGNHLDGAPTTIGPAPKTKARSRARAKLHDETWDALKRAWSKARAVPEPKVDDHIDRRAPLLDAENP